MNAGWHEQLATVFEWVLTTSLQATVLVLFRLLAIDRAFALLWELDDVGKGDYRLLDALCNAPASDTRGPGEPGVVARPA